MKGCKRFLDRLWGLQDILTEGESYSDALRSKVHKTIKKVTNDIESMKFNTAIAAMMTLINDIYALGAVNKAELKDLLLILSPFAPHITSEMFQSIYGGYLNEQKWPSYDEKLCKDDTVEIAVQVNGKLKAKLTIPTDMPQEEVLAMAKADENVAKACEGKTVVKEIYVKGRLVNLAVK